MCKCVCQLKLVTPSSIQDYLWPEKTYKLLSIHAYINKVGRISIYTMQSRSRGKMLVELLFKVHYSVICNLGILSALDIQYFE